jgi:hypothetical protein
MPVDALSGRRLVNAPGVLVPAHLAVIGRIRGLLGLEPAHGDQLAQRVADRPLTIAGFFLQAATVHQVIVLVIVQRQAQQDGT